MIYPLKTNRLRIEPLALADAPEFAAYRSDEDIARYQSWDAPYSVDKAIELIESQAGLELPAKGDWLQLGIHLTETGDLVGDLALHALDEIEVGFEIGYTIATRFQRQGFAKESVTALLAYLLQELGAKRVIATPDRRNLPSIRLLKSLGFVQREERSWEEFFKGENVTVDYYELVNTQ
ncbi:MAG: N-acetyltransferase [Actinobacteria bacterium]|nr:N-acetyltransferase [Actinomycetota bacterium]